MAEYDWVVIGQGLVPADSDKGSIPVTHLTPDGRFFKLGAVLLDSEVAHLQAMPHCTKIRRIAIGAHPASRAANKTAESPSPPTVSAEKPAAATSGGMPKISPPATT